MPKYLETFDKKKLPLFDKSVMILEFCTKQCYHVKESVSVQCFDATIGVPKTDRKKP